MQGLWYDPADQIVSRIELTGGNVHLRTWNAAFFKVLSPDHGCRISGGSYPSPTKSKSLGIRKSTLGVQQLPQVILMPTAFWRPADLE